MSRDVQIAGAAGAAPQAYTVPNATEIIPRAINATFDGTGAASAFKPTVEIVSDGGVVVARIPTDTTVAAGASAEVSFFPRVRRPIVQGGVTYAQQILILKGSYTLVAEWHLNEGASPWADTSGFAPGDPATLTRQVRATAMTQNNGTGPLAEAPAGPSVAFNFDGTAVSGSGDFLTDAVATPSRYYFANNLPFTVVAWVIPGAGVNVHEGPLVGVVHVTSFGMPTAHDDGWQLNVTQPGLIPKIQRYSNVTSGGTPDSAAGSALPTNAWTMLAGTYDGATLKLYVNGALVASQASAGAIGGVASNVLVGVAVLAQGNVANWYFGAAAEISVWAATFTATDIANLYAAASA